jgi:mannose-6-phosphate isomerase-like protein (cupin superfamily)
MTDKGWLFSLADVTAKLPPEAEPIRFCFARQHGTMKLGLYAPRGPDVQVPHAQDELYVIASGSGYFNKAGERRPFGAQDVIFVEAGVEHRFEDFSDDFSAWVVFWGPDGGEG